MNRSSNDLKDRQKGGKGSKTMEDVSEIIESGGGTLAGVEAEKDYKGLFLDYDVRSKAIRSGKQELTWTGTANVVDDSPLFLLQGRSRRIAKKTHKLQFERVHAGNFGLSEGQPTSHKWKGASKNDRNLRTPKYKRKLEERNQEYDGLFLDVAPVRGLAGQVAAGSGSGLFADSGDAFAGARTEREDKRRTGSFRAKASLTSRSQPKPRVDTFKRKASLNGLTYPWSSNPQPEEPFRSSSETIFRFSVPPPTIQDNVKQKHNIRQSVHLDHLESSSSRRPKTSHDRSMNRESLRGFFIPEVEAERSPPLEISSFVRGSRQSLKATQRGGAPQVRAPSAPILSPDQPHQSLQPPTSQSFKSFYEPPDQPLLSPDLEPHQPQTFYQPPKSQSFGPEQPQTPYQLPLSADLGPAQSSYLPPGSQPFGPAQDTYGPPLSPDLGPLRPKPSYQPSSSQSFRQAQLQDSYGPPLSSDLGPSQPHSYLPLSSDLTPPQPPRSSSFGSQEQQLHQSYQPPLSQDLGPIEPKPSYEPPEVPLFGPSKPQTSYQAPLSSDLGPIEPRPSYKPQFSEDLAAPLPSYQPSTSQTSSLGSLGSTSFLEDSLGHRSYHIHSQDRSPSPAHTSYHIHVTNPHQLKLIQEVLQEDHSQSLGSSQRKEQRLTDLPLQPTEAASESSYFPLSEDSSEALSPDVPPTTSYFPPSEQIPEDEALGSPAAPRPTGYIVYKYVPKTEENKAQQVQDYPSKSSTTDEFGNLTLSSNYILAARPFKDKNTSNPEVVGPGGRPPAYVVYKFLQKKPKTSCYFWCK